MESLDALRFAIGVGYLLYAAVLDLRTRRVPNEVWMVLGSIAGILFLFDWLLLDRFDWIDLVVAVGIVALAYVLWYVHILAGGADAKALMALGILLPEPIRWGWDQAALPLWTSPLPGAIVVLANSVLLFSLAPVILLVLNLARGDLRFPAMLLGYRMDLARAEASFVWIVDRVRDDGAVEQVLFPSQTTEEAYSENARRLRERGILRVWTTPKIPFMVPLGIGFLAAFSLGDVLFKLVQTAVIHLR